MAYRSSQHLWRQTYRTVFRSTNPNVLCPRLKSKSQLPIYSASTFVLQRFYGSKVGESGAATSVSSSLKQAEVAKFAAIAETWWDIEGPFKPLHAMNPTRVSFIRSTLCRHFRKDPNCARPLEGLKIIDVGCGGGILSEPLARLGATVTGIDAVEKNIRIARLHAGLDPSTSSIEYSCATAEQLVELNREFDAVIALEVIEHVANPSEFCQSLAALTAANGATVISTINRSMRAYAAAIVAAEYILRWVLINFGLGAWQQKFSHMHKI
ncbi:ubiquinone biosynthesis O-methyltransferase, mitochondrial isoform X2 [Amborella trichopoda]|uniref:ubiquinone biosynthesis O-methyltransferase, mitochondrial isoform X2 n=1 Tax=Amborella trichopoda TaxID=13333 RepID=UPI0009BEDEB9|nr:ubiquinone biosynthesis O-methyltransferase, mitochondrial isoform X2 [Amborella trichopoda]|eukprot:XP_020524897.1 ubiquinone biosynthesis O-methyltransferase, mitochondrial isoform X2 [Amborella trichopoda]